MRKDQNIHTRILFLIHLLVTFLHTTIPETTTGLRLKLIPWHSPASPSYQKYQKVNKYANQVKIQFPMQKQENFRYAVDIKFGTPGREVKLLLDTSGSFIWTECSLTSKSYHPRNSRTSKILPCKHPLCAQKICKCIKNQCVCTIKYGSGGYKYTLAGNLTWSSGAGPVVGPSAHLCIISNLVRPCMKWNGTIDTFQLPGSAKSESDIVFGCTNKQPLNLSGILGLDRSPVSLLGQLRREIGGQFSYCLNKGDNYLTLGKDSSFDERKEIKTTPLIHTAYSTLFLNLTDISVAGKRLGLYPRLFELKNGGVFMDTGIQYTVLPRKAYDKVSKALQSYFKGKLERTARTFLNLKPCYELTPGFKDYPTMTFHFQGADYEAEYVQVVDESTNMTCTALFPGRRTVIGALQQWNTKFMFDINQNVLKFYKDDCAP